MSARMIMKNDYSKRSMPLNWGVSKRLTTSLFRALGVKNRTACINFAQSRNIIPQEYH